VPPRLPKWQELLAKFISQLRIVSREVSVKPGERGAQLKLWRSQHRILDEIAKGMDEGVRKFYVLKSRQLGSTTVFVVILLFWLAMHPKTKGALVVDHEGTRDNFRETIREIITSIPAKYFGDAFAIKKGADNRNFMAFTNGSQLNFLVAGTSKDKVSWGESSGYSVVILTEIANYGSEEGLNNFEEAMSETNPERLYVYESTAKGRNMWFKRWQAAEADPFSIRRIFVGWWSKELNAIPVNDPKFAIYGRDRPDSRESAKIAAVQERFGHTITMEQLAWRRWKSADTSKSESSLDQNQPWVPEEAFVVSGHSFFQTRLLSQNLERITSEPTVLRLPDGASMTVAGIPYKAYRFWMGEDFWSASLQQLDGLRDSPRDIQLRIWHEPVLDGRYVIGCDPAGGRDDKNNNHAISIFRCYADRLIQVAEYADNMAETAHCAWVLAYLAGVYRNCQIIVELNGGYGKAVMTELDHLRDQLRAEHNAHKRGAANKANPKGQDWTDFLSMARYYIYRRPDNPASAGFILNWITNFDNKRLVFSEMRDSHMNGALVINSRPLLEEMLDVVEDSDKSTIGAPGNQKDDRVMAACLANHAYVQDERPGLIMQGMTFEKVTREEAGARTKGHIVNNIVAQHFRNHEEGVAEVPPHQQWMANRGLI